MAKKGKFNTRRQLFIDLIVEGKSGSEAARGAGYSEKGANRRAEVLLSNSDISDEIDRRLKEIAESSDIKGQDIIDEYAKIAFANSEDFFGWGEVEVVLIDGIKTQVSRVLIKPPSEIDRNKKAAIAGIKETSTGGLEFKFHDKQRALGELKKYFGLDNEQEIKKAIAIKKAEHKYSDNNLSDMTAEELIQIINACKQTDN